MLPNIEATLIFYCGIVSLELWKLLAISSLFAIIPCMVVQRGTTSLLVLLNLMAKALDFVNIVSLFYILLVLRKSLLFFLL